MFYKGIKRFFLIVGVLVVASVVFVGCKDNKTKVSNIAFKESEAITLIIGEEYGPQVSITPSYASNLNYYFEATSNSNVIELVGTKIKAIGEGVAQLKVISKDDENLNDVIAVKVIRQAVKLNSPKNLTFNGTSFRFDYEQNATKYIVDVNGVTFDIGVKNYISIEEISKKLTNVYNSVLKVKVQTVGDGRLTESSEFSGEIKVLKIGTLENLRVENNFLKFSKLSGVKYYDIKVIKNGSVTENLTIEAENYNEVVDIDLISVLSNVQGECEIVVSSSDRDYQTEEGATVFASSSNSLSLTVLGIVNNLNLHQSYLHWDSVIGADYYNLYDEDGNLKKSNILSNEFNVLDIISEKGSYAYKLKAFSKNITNVVNIGEFSSLIEFEVLDTPTITFDENGVNWSEVDNAVGYGIKITDSNNEVRTNQILVSNSFSLSNYLPGEYKVEISTQGNGVTCLNSLIKAEARFKILSTVTNLAISNKIVSWQGEATNGYNLIVKDAGGEEIRNEVVTSLSYDLNSFYFNAGDYTLYVQALGNFNISQGETAVYNAGVAETKFTQLADIDISSVNVADNEISFTTDAKTDHIEVSDSEKLSKVNLTTYSFENDKLSVGDNLFTFLAKGNNGNIFDSKNGLEVTLTKLATPSGVTLDKESGTFTINSVANASEYDLFVNNNKDNGFNVYDNLNAGDYTITAQAIGKIDNNTKTYIIDSSTSNAVYTVKKLATPSLTFYKENLSFKVNTEETVADENIKFTLGYNGTIQTLQVTNKVVDCSSLMAEEGEYTATVCLQGTGISGNSIEIDSEETSLTVHRVGASTISMKIVRNPEDNSESIVIDCSPSIETNYTIKLKVNNTDEIELNLSNDYTVELCDENYLTNSIFTNSGVYTISAILVPNDNDKLESKKIDLGEITKIDKVNKIRKDGNNIVFDSVTNASAYKLQFNAGSEYYYINLSSNSISIEDLKSNLLEKGYTVLENTNYDVKVVAVGNTANSQISSISDETFTFKILSTPGADFKIFSDGKSIQINNVTDAEKYTLVATDGTSPVNKVLTNSNGANIALKDITDLSTGEITVKIKATSTDDNIFDSAEQELKYTILGTPIVSVSGGVVSWAYDEHASHYIININGTDNILLSGVSSYDLKDLNLTKATITLQAISNFSYDTGFYYDSPISSEMTVTKLSSPTISTNGGELVIQIPSTEIAYIDDIIIIHNRTHQESSVKTLLSETEAEISSSMVIEASRIVEYLSTIDGIALEEFSIQVIAKADSTYLNSSISNFYLKGLQKINSIEVQTSYNIGENIGETLDQIVWTNNALNTAGVAGYKIKITYNGKDYYYPDGTYASATSYTFPNHDDFGVGEYTISIKVIATGSGEEDGKSFYWVNSNWSKVHTIYLNETPSELKTDNGLVVWGQIQNAEAYIVRVYNYNEELEKETLIYSNKVSTNKFDFNSFTLADEAGIYKVSVQAINESNKTIISSEESEKLEVLRLPTINEYYLDNGELYVKVHNFATAIKLTLIGKEGIENGISYEYSSNSTSQVVSLDQNKDIKVWSDITDIAKILEQDAVQGAEDNTKYGYHWVKFEPDKNSIIKAIAQGYSLKLMAIGNSSVISEGVSSLALVNSDETDSTAITETGYLKNNNDNNLNTVIKLATPTIQVTERGVVSWGSDVEYDATNFVYFKDETNAGFSGLLIYKITLSGPNEDGTGDYEFYCVDNLDVNNLPNGVIYNEKTQADEYSFGYIIYKGNYINVLRYIDKNGEQQGALKIDFNQDNLYFRTLTGNGEINLTKGGNFAVSVSLLGDCTNYLTSNSTNSISITRYETLGLSVSGGDIIWKNLASENDSPVYLVTVTSGENTYYVYLYDKAETYSTDDVPVKRDGYTYVHGVDFTTQEIKYSLDTLKEDKSFLFGDGTYTVNITTYYKATPNLQVIQSLTSQDYTYTKLKSPKLSITNGEISFEQISGKTDNITNYEVTITDDTKSYSYMIGSSDYTISSGSIYYALPKTIKTIDGETITLEEGRNYTISVRAIPKVDDIISSNSSTTISGEVENSVTGITMENGVLTWNGITGANYEILMSIKKSTETGEYELYGQYISTTDKNSFKLPTSEITDTSGKGYYLTSDYLYEFDIKHIGSSSKFSSFYTKYETEVEKLKTISGITVKDGVLTWNEITDTEGKKLDGIKYVINYTLTNGGTTTGLEELYSNSFDFAGLGAGKYSLSIKSTHNDYFESDSSSTTVYKLPTVNTGNVTITNDENGIPSQISWFASTINDLYADYYLVKIGEQDKTIEPKNPNDDTISMSLEGIDLTNKTIQIRAMSSQTNLINSEWTEGFNFDKAEKIDVSTFVRNGLNFEWREPASAGDSYRYILTYTLNGLTITQKITDYRTEGEGETQYKVYYFTPTVIGVYTNITVVVTKGGNNEALASDKVVMQDSETGTNYIYDFNLFASGEGTIDKPYEINTTSHFENIKFFNSAHYKITANLNFEGKDAYTTSVIACEFSGVLDGQDNIISNLKISSLNNNVAIFSSTNKATIKNLTIENSVVEITSSYIDTAFYGAVLVANATNTIFENINIAETVLNITGNAQNATINDARCYYYGGIAGYIAESTIRNCNVSLGYSTNGKDTYATLDFKGDVNDYIYFGAVAGNVSDSTISVSSSDNSEVNSEVIFYYEIHNNMSSNILANVYVGGVAGYVTGESTISHLNVKTYQSDNYTNFATYNGGVVGYVNAGEISYVDVSGKIGTGKETNSEKIGKLVAFADESVVLSSNSVTDMTLNKGNASEDTTINNQ